MNDKIIIETENDKINKLEVIDDKGEIVETGSSINVLELERENTIEILEDRKSKLSKIVEYNKSLLDSTIKFEKTIKFIYPICYALFFALMISKNPEHILNGMIKDIICDFAISTLFGSAVMLFGVVTFAALENKQTRDYEITKANLDEITKDLENEKTKTYENSQKMEFKFSNKRLEELNDKYEEKYGDYFNDINYEYSRILYDEKETTRKETLKKLYEEDDGYVNYDEKPKTIVKKRK